MTERVCAGCGNRLGTQVKAVCYACQRDFCVNCLHTHHQTLSELSLRETEHIQETINRIQAETNRIQEQIIKELESRARKK